MKIKDLTLGEMQGICDTSTCNDCVLNMDIEEHSYCIKLLKYYEEEINLAVNCEVDVERLQDIDNDILL